MRNSDRLNEIINEIDELIDKKVDDTSPDFQAWKVKTEEFIIDQYGKEGPVYEDFKSRTFTTFALYAPNPHEKHVNACREDLQCVKKILQECLKGMTESTDVIDDKFMKEKQCTKIFIVHGHDVELKESVARIVECQGITPIILDEQVNKGSTIIEKFEENANVSAAICLFTADDYGGEAQEGLIGKGMRARQNVVFETGYMMAKLGRENIIIIGDMNIEIPSDLEGIVQIDRNKEDYRMRLLKELKNIGYDIDANKLI